MLGARGLCASDVPPKIHAFVQDADNVDPTCNQAEKQNIRAGG
jgi:hypothetical protein